jgi:hypothetical protein
LCTAKRPSDRYRDTSGRTSEEDEEEASGPAVDIPTETAVENDEPAGRCCPFGHDRTRVAGRNAVAAAAADANVTRTVRGFMVTT